jgi:hypothetical protein
MPQSPGDNADLAFYFLYVEARRVQPQAFPQAFAGHHGFAKLCLDDIAAAIAGFYVKMFHYVFRLRVKRRASLLQLAEELFFFHKNDTEKIRGRNVKGSVGAA